MNELAFDRREHRDRVVYQTRVRLLTFNPTRDTWVQAENLSETGMFATTSEPFTMDSELLVDVPLPTVEGVEPGMDPVSLAMRGRVVWLEKETSGLCGVGIAFLDLSATDRRALRAVVEVGRPMDKARCISISMPGVPGDVRAWATPSPEGLIISQHPPHLRGFSAPRDTVVQPRLDQTITSWPPLQSEEDWDDDDDDIIVDLDGPMTLSEAYGGQSTVEVAPLQLVEETTVVVEDMEPEDSEMETIPDLVNQLKDQPEETPFSMREDEALERSVWDLEPIMDSRKLLEQSVWEMKPLQDLERKDKPKSSRAAVTLWLVALLMGAIAVASMVHTGLWDSAVEELGFAGPAAASEEAWVPRTEAPVKKLTIATAPAPVVKKKVVEQKKPAPPVKVEEKKVAQKKVADNKGKGVVGLNMTNSAGAPTLVIPIDGSTKGASSYLLKEPNAVAINLPNATAKIAYRSYPLSTGGLRLAWVRARAGGLHLRFFFAGDVVPHSVHLEQGRVRLVLK